MSDSFPLNSPLWRKEPDYSQQLGDGLGNLGSPTHIQVQWNGSALPQQDLWMRMPTRGEFGLPIFPGSPSSETPMTPSSINEDCSPQSDDASMDEDGEDELMQILFSDLNELDLAPAAAPTGYAPLAPYMPQHGEHCHSILSPPSSSTTTSSSSPQQRRQRATKAKKIRKPREPFLYEMEEIGLVDEGLKNRIRKAKISRKYRVKVAKALQEKPECAGLCCWKHFSNNTILLEKLQQLLPHLQLVGDGAAAPAM